MKDDVNQSFYWQRSTQPIMNYQMLIVCHCMSLCFRGFYPLCCDGIFSLTTTLCYADHVNQSCVLLAEVKINMLS